MRNLLILLAVLCASCGTALPTVKPYKIDVQQGNVVTSKMLLQLRPGMTKSQVRFIMGTPLIQDSFHGNRWDYAYQMRENGKITEQRRVILDFESELLKTVRGDVAPKSGDQAADAANTGIRVIDPSTKPKEKSTLDKLKFWKGDKAEAVVAAPAVAAAAATAVVAEKATEQVIAAPLVTVPEQEVMVDDAQKSVLVQDVKLPAVSDKASVPVEVAAPANDMKAEVAPVANAAKTNEVVMQTVNEWAGAWRTKNLNQYLGFYSDKFKPEGNVSKKTWAAQRKLRLSDKSGDISLSLEDFQVQVNGNLATAQFFQKYRSKVYSDQASKVLNLEFDQKSNRWLIVKESAVVNAKRPETQKVLAPENTNEHLEGVIEKIGF
ncbi:MAG: outer membrane protein assembly factor BamE [Methylotenera sp.]